MRTSSSLDPSGNITCMHLMLLWAAPCRMHAADVAVSRHKMPHWCPSQAMMPAKARKPPVASSHAGAGSSSAALKRGKLHS